MGRVEPFKGAIRIAYDGKSLCSLLCCSLACSSRTGKGVCRMPHFTTPHISSKCSFAKTADMHEQRLFPQIKRKGVVLYSPMNQHLYCLAFSSMTRVIQILWPLACKEQGEGGLLSGVGRKPPFLNANSVHFRAEKHVSCVLWWPAVNISQLDKVTKPLLLVLTVKGYLGVRA